MLDWVPEALQACQDASAVHKADDAWMLPSRGNLLKLWYHLSAAEFCVQNRLKTPPHKKPEVRRAYDIVSSFDHNPFLIQE